VENLRRQTTRKGRMKLRSEIRKKALFNKRAENMHIGYVDSVEVKFNYGTKDIKELKVMESILYYQNIRRKQALR
jgi:hypothetical protein